MVKLLKINFVNTPSGWNEIESIIDHIPSEHRWEASLVAAMAWNLAVELADQDNLNKEKRNENVKDAL